jgi:uncharacterized repeat protein (TIGR01451 family)
MAFDKRIVSINGGNGNSLADAAGDVLNYVFTVKNEGSVTLTNLTVVDDLNGMSESLASLAPGATVVYNSSYVLTQADLDSNAGGDGVLTNTAIADTNETPSFVDAEGVTVVYQPGIDLTKYVSVDNGVTWLDANTETGPVLSSSLDIDPQFRYTVSNTGNITLADVTLTDAVYDLNGAAAGTSYSFGNLAVVHLHGCCMGRRSAIRRCRSGGGQHAFGAGHRQRLLLGCLSGNIEQQEPLTTRGEADVVRASLIACPFLWLPLYR